MEIKRKNFTFRERRLDNLDYKKYLYEKYKPTFSSLSLSFSFRGREYHLDALMAEFHRIEQDKIFLDYYVTALFIFLLCLGYWGVVALDAYLQSAR
jgi:hypothetical protein